MTKWGSRGIGGDMNLKFLALRNFLIASAGIVIFITSYFACTIQSTLSKGNDGGGGLSFFNPVTNEEDKSCIESSVPSVLTSKPVDIIFVIDNSGSMQDKLLLIADNINVHFTDEMKKSGLDYRVIMLVRHGASLTGNICIEAPLSSIPKGGCKNIGTNPPGNIPGKFYHYSFDIQSNDSLCSIINTLFNINKASDEFNLAPDGWIKWLRTSAFKVFIEITDDMPSCIWFQNSETQQGKKSFNDYNDSLGGQIAATAFEKILMKLAPEQFGTVNNRNYIFYSIVGMMEKPVATDTDTGLIIDSAGAPDDFFTPSEGIVADTCSTAMASGQGYQWLSKMTGGLRFPVCQTEKINIIFEKIAKSIDSASSVVCALDIPNGGSSGTVNLETVKITVTQFNGDYSDLIRVDSVTFCSGADNEFYFDNAGSTVSLCPNTCLMLKSTSSEIKLTAKCIEHIQ